MYISLGRFQNSMYEPCLPGLLHRHSDVRLHALASCVRWPNLAYCFFDSFPFVMPIQLQTRRRPLFGSADVFHTYTHTHTDTTTRTREPDQEETIRIRIKTRRVISMAVVEFIPNYFTHILKIRLYFSRLWFSSYFFVKMT